MATTGDEWHSLLSLLARGEHGDSLDQPLSELHAHCAVITQHLDQLTTCKDVAGAARSSAAHALCRAYHASVEAAALFSANEDAEDVSTADLKHLQAPYFFAELLTAAPCPEGPSQRAAAVQEALHMYSVFLQRCQQYALLGQAGSSMYRADEQQGGRMDPHSKRAAKIEAFKADRALAAQLSHLRAQRASSRCQSKQEEGREGGPVGGARGWDEEDERRLWGTVLQQAALRALGQRWMLQEELRVVQHAATQAVSTGQQQKGRSSVRDEAEAVQRQEMLQQLQGIANSLGNAAVNLRQEQAAKVFRPSHLLPTRTLAQQADLEMQDARRRQEAEQAQAARAAAHKAELGSNEDEEELYRQRARDDWQDLHPRGWGNSKLKPCG